MRRIAIVIAAVSIAMCLGTSRIRAQDVDAMAKWTAAQVLHYRAVGEFSGDAPILSGKLFSRTAKATDRVEIEFDWDNHEMKILGKPVIRNFPTKVGAIQAAHETGLNQPCPESRVDGALEHWTVESVTSTPMMVQIQGKRTQPAGAIPYNSEYSGKCGSLWDAAAAKTETLALGFQVPMAMLLAFPQAGGDVEVTKDGKSLVLKASGWVWTMTPTIVK